MRDAFSGPDRQADLTGAPPPDVLIIGVGNDLRGDDGAGLETVRRLALEADPGRGAGTTAVRCYDGDGAGLLECWRDVRAVVLVDAVRSGAPAGTIHRFDASETPLPAPMSHGSTHAIGMAEAIELARVLGRLPETVVVYGIEGARFGSGQPMSDAVIAALEPVRAAVHDEVRGLVR